MKVLIKDVLIIDADSPYHKKKVSLLLDKGKVAKIYTGSVPVLKVDKLIEQKGLQLSPGLCDMWANFCDPGYEHRETLESGYQASIAGGMTAVILSPQTNPAISSKSQINYIKTRSKDFATELYPYACISEKSEGEKLTELYDLNNAGAIAYTDGKSAQSDSGLLLRSLQYVKSFDGLVCSWPFDASLAGKGVINEGVINVQTGLKGIPAIAEETVIERDLSIAAYCDAPLHFSMISTAESVKKIKKAKDAGMKITAAVSINNLLYDESALMNFDTNLKLNPPLRSEADKKALIKAIKSGIIDVVVSDHEPVEEELKKCEFDYAAAGSIGIQTLFANLFELTEDIDLTISLLSKNPRKILKLDKIEIKEGADANFTLYETKSGQFFNTASNRSLSSNSNQFDVKHKVKVFGIVNKDKIALVN